EAVETLTMLSAGVQSGAIATVSDMYGPDMQSGLKSGKILGVNMPSWYSTYGIQPSAPEQAGTWRIAPLHRFASGGGRTGAGGGTDFAALRNKPATEAAVQLITSTYLDKEQQVARYKAMGYLPTLRSVYESQELISLEDEFFGGQRLFEVYRDIIDEAPAVHQRENKPIMDTVLPGHLLRAYRGPVSPAAAPAGAAPSAAAAPPPGRSPAPLTPSEGRHSADGPAHRTHRPPEDPAPQARRAQPARRRRPVPLHRSVLSALRTLHDRAGVRSDRAVDDRMGRHRRTDVHRLRQLSRSRP